MPQRPSILVGALVIAGIIAIGGALHDRLTRPSGPSAPGGEIAGRARVIDGDSLEIGSHRIRLFGIDAPEGRQDCRDEQGRVYACGAEARTALAAAIGSAAVSCTPVGESYDRDVAICTAGGRDLSEAMVRSGHALELRHHSRGRYAEAERDARAARRGLWEGSFERPSQWRQEHPR